MNFKKIYYSTIGGIHKNVKLFYYLHGISLMLIPQWICRIRSKHNIQKFSSLSPQEQEYINKRVNYYCRLSQSIDRDSLSNLPTLRDNNFHKSNKQYVSALARRKHRLAGPLPFFFDSYEYTRCFPQNLKWNIEGGDVNTEMQVPTITKSRLIPSTNNSSMNVLLNLNKVRHFVFFHDPITWEEKQPIVLFRGVVANKPRRQQFLDMWEKHPFCNIKNACDLTLYDHLQYRYIMALEGNDVASNLKWIMSSNSLAVMPRPTCETWYMEGRLIPNVHYIEIADDYHDLIEKVEYYEKHPEEAHHIIANAHAWVHQFLDKKRERMISLLVMDKYLKTIN